MNWQELAAEKKAHQLDGVPKEWLPSNLPSSETLNVIDFPRESDVLSALDLEITESAVAILLSNLASSKWSAVQVTTSFYKRAIVAQQLTNCLTEIFVKRALARAKELDEHLAKTGKVVGVLHGLPISLKDQISIKGIESTMGSYISWIGKVADKNSVLVDILESLGAVPFVKTNLPQTLMWIETFNHIFGRTTNPNNRSLTSGGSSGGEGALITPLGVGTDIGGSIRIPAGFCGVYGFRPSYNRIPFAGSVNSLDGQDSVVSVLGPLSNTLDGLQIFFKAVLSKEPWKKDPLVIRKRWSDEEYNLIDHGNGKKLCFAIMWDNGIVAPHPPIRRGLQMTKDALLAAGHQVIDWKPYKQKEILANVVAICCSAATEEFKSVMAPDEPLVMSMKLIPEEGDMPGCRSPDGGVSAFELWKLHKKKRDLRQEHAKYWEDTVGQTGTGRPVDAIISPIAPHTALPHGQQKHGQYTMTLNMLDYPSLVIPVSKVDQALDVKQPRVEFYTPEDRKIYELYDPAMCENAPIGIQVIGRTMEEEAVLAMSAIVDEALKGAKRLAKAIAGRIVGLDMPLDRETTKAAVPPPTVGEDVVELAADDIMGMEIGSLGFERLFGDEGWEESRRCDKEGETARLFDAF
ncbi:Amidase domain-containing protein [Mycena sanguinolenta]|uniref:Amidase domain-containing protein n=1 Tax=Mycena sanguinolenta TaxID=230812 RepID=A0A8H7CK89_9AGAR|nr:Amidase domain-containing protein [Mycena sanguinolenta]